jgi:hypothetical protein
VENSAKYKALVNKLDSLQGNYGVKSNELDKAFATLNEVEEGLKFIRESENILAMQSKEGLDISDDNRNQIKQDIQLIQDAIDKYKNKIKQLEKENGIQSKEFKKRLDAINKELQQKFVLIESLQKQIEEKDSQIKIKTEEIISLEEIVSDLKDDVNNLSEEGTQLKEKIIKQDKELYSAYYIVGTKGQLIDAGVMTKGGLFKSSKISYQAEKNVFVEIDYREITTINTNANKAKVLSIHPKGTYAFEKQDEEVILTISDPDLFWEQTKYLVIQVQ